MMMIVIRSLAAMIIGAHLLLPGITDYVPTITVLIHFILSPFSSENIPPNVTSSDEIALPSHYLLIFWLSCRIRRQDPNNYSDTETNCLVYFRHEAFSLWLSI